MQFTEYTLSPHEIGLWEERSPDGDVFRAATLATARGIADRTGQTVLLGAVAEDARKRLLRAVAPTHAFPQPMVSRELTPDEWWQL